MIAVPMDLILEKLKPLLARLIKNFQTGTYDQRRESAIALSKFKGEKATDFLLKTYESDNIQDFMALALGNIESEKAVSLLMNALNDSQQEVRFSAAQALGMIKNDEAFNVLMEALNEYADANISAIAQPANTQIFFEEDTIISAIIALGRIHNHLSVPLLKRLLAQEKSPRIRASVIMALGMMANERMLPVFQGALRDEDPRVRANAIEAIEAIKSSSIVGIVQPYLEDPSNRVKANVAKAIWRFGDFDVSTTLQEMLSHPDKWYRASAAYALGEIQDPRFIPILAAALKDEDADVRRNSTNALKRLESPDALPHLIPLLDDPNYDVRVQASLAITRCGPTRIPELLFPKLRVETNSIVKATLISCLGTLHIASCVTEIAPFLTDEDPRVVSNAIDAIHRILPDAPDPTLAKKFKELMSHEDNRVKANAIRALWHWREFSALDILKDLLNSDDPKYRQSGTFVLGEIGNAISEVKTMAKAINNLIADLLNTDVADAPSPSIEVIDASTPPPEEAPRDEPAPQVEPPPPPNFERDLEMAANALAAREFSTAESIFQRVLNREPDNLQALLGIGNLCFILKRHNESAAFYEKALTFNPNLVKPHYNLGTIYFFQKDYPRSQDHLLKALKLYPKLLGGYLILAQIFQFSGRTQESIRLLTRAVELSPRNPILYQKLAMLHIHLKQYEPAIDVLTKAVTLSPLDVEANLLLAYCQHLTNRFQEAFQAMDQTLKACAQAGNPEESLRTLLQSYLFISSTIQET